MIQQQQVRLKVKTNLYGEKISHDQPWIGPLNLKRSATDKKWLMFMISYVLFWLFVAFFVLNDGEIEIIWYSQSSPDFEEINNKQSLYYHMISDIILDMDGTKFISEIFGFALISGLLTTWYILMLHRWAKVFVWTVMCLVHIFIICISLISGITFYQNPKNETKLLVFLSFIILLICYSSFVPVLKGKINIACEVIREACKCLTSIPSTLMVPFLTASLVLPVTIFSTWIFANIICKKTLQQSSMFPLILHLINLIGSSWICSFLFDASNMILSITFASWYWTRDGEHLTNYLLAKSAWITLRYHLGTVALGSLIAKFCELIVSTLRKLKKSLRSCCCCYHYNPVAWVLSFSFGCCLNDLVRNLRHINKNAYITSAAHGSNYFNSATDAFNLLMRNLLKVYAINNVVNPIIIMGKIMVILSTLVLRITYDQTYSRQKNDSLKFQVVGFNLNFSTLITFLVSFLISECVFLVLRIAINTMFLSILEDSERNNGSELQPYFMSRKLEKLVLMKFDTSVDV